MSITPQSSNQISSNERLFATIPHFSFFLAILPFVILDGLLGIQNNFILNTVALVICPGSCFVIFFINRTRSQFVSFHSLQAAIFHSILISIVAFISFIFRDALDSAAAMLPTMILMPFLCIWPFLALFGGISSFNRKDFKYPIIGEWAKSIV
jgi:uncharacterized membrane protein